MRVRAGSQVFDVFVSYRHSDAEVVRHLVSALEQQGMRVWFDESSIPDFGGITDSARIGLAESKALLIYYSSDYPHSSPCQWELTSGFLAAMRLGDPRSRVLVVNPESGPGHIEPVELRDARYQVSRSVDPSGIDSIAKAVSAHVAGITGELGAGILTPAVWLPSQPSAATRFVGRWREMWQIHSALHAHRSSMTQLAVGPGVLQVRGLGGLGKSLLAREYALRYSESFPGGVFWLYAQGDLTAGSNEIEREALRIGQLHAFAASVLGPERAPGLDGLAPYEVEAVLRNSLAGSLPCLWVVDDLPPGMSAREVYSWLGPASSCTLVTTRSGEYSALMPEVHLGVLGRDEALQVLFAAPMASRRVRTRRR